MNLVLKTSLFTFLLFFSLINTHADDAMKSSAATQDVLKKPDVEAQYILPPPSPFFSSNITYAGLDSNNDEKQLAAVDSTQKSNNDLEATEKMSSSNATSQNDSRIQELEKSLKENQAKIADLVDELHATAKNGDFENEMYEKTVSLLQEKIAELSEKNKTVTTKLAGVESEAGNQQSLLTSLKKESTELSELKNSYLQRNEEIYALKKQIEYFEEQRKLNGVSDTKVITLLQEEIAELNEKNKAMTSKLVGVESEAGNQQSLLSSLKKESADFSKLKNTHQQRNEEVSALKKQIEYFEEFRKLSDSTDTKIQTLEDAYTSKSEEVDTLQSKLGDLEAAIKGKEKEAEQTQAELSDLLNETSELNETNQLLKTKVVELDNANKSLQSQLITMQQEASEHTRKLGLLDHSSAELEATKSAYKERNDEVHMLKSKLQELNESNKLLLADIEKLKSESSQNNEKIGLLNQSKVELETTQAAFKDSSNEAIVLKSKLQGAEVNNQLLLAEIENLKAQSNTDLDALKGAYNEQTQETGSLKEKIEALDNQNKTLLSKIEKLESDASQNVRKLGMLDQNSAELMALKSAYKERNEEVVSLKDKVTKLDDSNKSLLSELVTLKSNASQQTRKLGLLDKSTSELTALKSAYKERNEEVVSLKDKVTNLDDSNKSLLSELVTLKSNASQQTRKLGLLDKSTAELTALKSAYKERNDENVVLKKQIAEADKNKEGLNKQLKMLKPEIESLKQSNKTLNSDNSELTVKLNQLRTLKSSLDTSTDKLATLQKMLDESENKSKTLTSKIKTLEADSSNQKRQLTSMSSISKELDALKNVYKELKKENLEMNKQYSEAMLDSDNDGVVNKLDKCQSSPSGISVDRYGCADIADADDDKIADANDLCPKTALGTKVNEFGCDATQNITLKGVNFKIGSDKLTPSSLPILKAAANTLAKNPNIKVEVAGYTDSLGLKAINQKLSKRRANSVAIELIKQGIDANRITVNGYGESNPIASNDNEAGRLINRRVELKIR